MPLNHRVRDIIDYVLLAIGIAGMILALVGEWYGWWHDFGVVVAVMSFGLALLSTADLNGRRLLARFEGQEGRMDRMLSKQDSMLSKQDAMLSKQDQTNLTLDRIARILDERLAPAG